MRKRFERRLSFTLGLLVAATILAMALVVAWNSATNILAHYEDMAVSYTSLGARYVVDSAELREEEQRRAIQRMTLAKVRLRTSLEDSGTVPPGQSWDAFSALLEQSLNDLVQSILPPFSLQGAVSDVYTRFNISRAMVLDDRGEILAVAGPGLNRKALGLIDRFMRHPENGPVTGRVGWEVGVAMRLTLPDREPMVLYMQHRIEHGLRLIRDTIAYVTLFTVVMLAIALFAAFRISKELARPIGTLARGVRAIGEGNLDYRVQLDTRDEIQEVAQAVGNMAGSLRMAMDELEQETLRRERLEHELHIAAELQLALLPEAPPTMKGLDLLGWSRPAKEVGGDFYDFIELGPDRLAVAIGDATGKGLPAALLVTECWSVMRTLVEDTESPAELLRRTNAALSRRIRASGRFVTLFFMIVDVRRGILRFASAGHNPPLLVGVDENRRLRLTAEEGFPLGVVARGRFSEHEVPLEPGDTLLLYSDGLTEAQNSQGELYGEDRVHRKIAEFSGSGLLELLAGIKQDMDDHVGDAEIFDDVTLVGVRLQPQPAPVAET